MQHASEGGELVAPQIKEAIATSSTLDFVALSACDEDDVAQCDDTHTQTEVLKRSRTPPTTRRPVPVKCQRMLQLGLGPPPSEHPSSEGPSSELGDFDMHQLPVIGTRSPARKDLRRPQSSRGDSRAGGSRAGDSLVLSSSENASFSDTASPRLSATAPVFVMPRCRSLRLVPGTRCLGARPPSSLCGELAGLGDRNLGGRPPSSCGDARPPSSLWGLQTG